MAERGSDIPIELDEVEIQIITSFDLPIDCLNRRKARILAEYRGRRGGEQPQIDPRDAYKRYGTRDSYAMRMVAYQQLFEAKLDLQSRLKSNELRSTLDKLSSDIDFKLKLLELEESGRNNDKLLFEYNMKDMDKIISQLGRITENLLEPPDGLPYFALDDNEVKGKLGFREGLNSNKLDIQDGDKGKARTRSLASGMEDHFCPDLVDGSERMHQIEHEHSATPMFDRDHSMKSKTTMKKLKNVFSNWRSPETLTKKEALAQQNKSNYCEIETLPRHSSLEKESGDGERALESSPKVPEIQKYLKQDWFFGAIKGSDAESKLLTPWYPQGTFLVRESETRPGLFTISVRDQDLVIHYRIKESDSGDFFLEMNKTFKTVEDLVGHYSNYADGLCTKLTVPCPKVMDDSRWEVKRSTLKLGRKLGAGQFTEVWEGLWSNKIRVAIKTLRPGTMSREDFLAEATIMKKLHHENLIQLFAVCTIEEPIYIVTEYMAKGALLEFLLEGDGGKLKEQELIDIGAQVAAGMAHLEMHHCIHRDLAARNVLVGDVNQIKVADFGLARVIDEDIYMPRTEAKFPIKWTAPEALVYRRYSIKSDVWSFGVLLMEVITMGRIPYPRMTNAQVIAEVPQPRNYRMPKPQNCPDYLYKIILDCWNQNADDRPTFETLKYLLNDYYVAAENPVMQM